MTEQTSQAVVDTESLGRWFADHVADVDGPLTVELAHGGYSNLTYAVSDGTRRWALRRPPLGSQPPAATLLAREFRVTAALRASAIPVAPALAYCDDPDVIGAPFSVAGWVDGHVVRSTVEAAALDAAAAARCGHELGATLAALHRIDPAAVGLDDLGRPDGFLTRQVERWSSYWAGVAPEPSGPMHDLARRLATAVPAHSSVGIVHGDYRIDNVILRPDGSGEIAAVLDWEMATIGDPLTDVGLLLLYWDPVTTELMPGGHIIGANPAFPSPDDLCRTYGEATGADLDGIGFYVALGCLKLGTLAERARQRHRHGLTLGEGFEQIGGAEPLAAHGLDALR